MPERAAFDEPGATTRKDRLRDHPAGHRHRREGGAVRGLPRQGQSQRDRGRDESDERPGTDLSMTAEANEESLVEAAFRFCEDLCH